MLCRSRAILRYTKFRFVANFRPKNIGAFYSRLTNELAGLPRGFDAIIKLRAQQARDEVWFCRMFHFIIFCGVSGYA